MLSVLLYTYKACLNIALFSLVWPLCTLPPGRGTLKWWSSSSIQAPTSPLRLTMERQLCSFHRRRINTSVPPYWQLLYQRYCRKQCYIEYSTQQKDILCYNITTSRSLLKDCCCIVDLYSLTMLVIFSRNTSAVVTLYPYFFFFFLACSNLSSQCTGSLLWKVSWECARRS